MDKDVQEKVASCKALQGKTVEDLIACDKFHDNVAAYLTAQREDRKQIRASYAAMKKVGGAKGYKLPAHPIDRLADLSVDEFIKEYRHVIGKVSARPFAERQYIFQLGQQAYNLTVAQIVCEEYPELESVLIPKSKGN